MKNGRILGNLLLLLTAAIWGTAFVAQRVGMDTIEPITFNMARSVLGAAAVGVPAVFLRRRKAARSPAAQARRASDDRHTLAGGVCCGVFLAAASIFQQMGLVSTTAGKAGFITAMYMLLVPVINFAVFKKKNTWLVRLAVLTGVAGMYLLCISDGLELSRGDALVGVCALLFSCHILCCDRFVRRGDPIGMSAVQFAAAAVISGVFALIFEQPTWEKLVSAAVPILYCGLISSGVGYTLQIVAQKFTEPTTASLLMSFESVFAAAAGAILLNERMTPREIAGCAVMFAAIILVQLPLPGGTKEERPADGR